MYELYAYDTFYHLAATVTNNNFTKAKDATIISGQLHTL